MGTNGTLRTSCFAVMVIVTAIFGVAYNLYEQSRLTDDAVVLVRRTFPDEIKDVFKQLKRDTSEDDPS